VSGATDEKPTLLLVDDQPSVLLSLSHIFEYAGFRVITAATAASALALVATRKIDGALIDVHMPQMSGIELCDRLRRSGVAGDYPIWLMTGAPNEAIRRHAANLGVAKVFAKPFDFSAVLQEITTGLS
jgi:CheY-like chemotaxis protein